MWPALIILGFLSMLLVPCLLAFFGGRRKDDPESLLIREAGISSVLEGAGWDEPVVDPYSDRAVEDWQEYEYEPPPMTAPAMSRVAPNGRVAALEALVEMAEDELMAANSELMRAKDEVLAAASRVEAAQAHLTAERGAAERSAVRAAEAQVRESRIRELKRRALADQRELQNLIQADGKLVEGHPSLDFPRRRGTHRAA